MNRLIKLVALGILGLTVISPALAQAAAPPATNPQSDSIGVNGRITGSAPSSAPTITTPKNGASFSATPIQVSGLCSGSLLVEIFKNDVFSGSVKCSNGSFSLQTDLFSGQNDLIARQYDGLDQASPDSNKVKVSFNNTLSVSGPQFQILTNYATRGANPGTQLSWPLTISGGTAPYAISVDWGDGSDTQLASEKASGDFSLSHVYKVAGSYNVTFKGTDANGEIAFLQAVGVANGAVQQSAATSGTSQNSSSASTNQTIPTKYKLAVVGLSLLSIAAFWLGRMHQLATLKARLNRGDRPF